MPRTRLLVFLMFGAQLLAAQHFYPLPGPLLTREVALLQANECFIYFDNPSGDSLQLRWRLLERSLPDGWDADLCDYGLCYEGIPPNGTMNPVFDTIRPYLKLIVQPEVVEGAGWVWFRVFEMGADTNFQDVFFNLHTPGTSAAHAPAPGSLTFFPNPARDVLFLSNARETPVFFEIYAANGQKMLQSEAPAHSHNTLPIADWPSGLYWLKSQGRVSKLLIQH